MDPCCCQLGGYDPVYAKSWDRIFGKKQERGGSQDPSECPSSGTCSVSESEAQDMTHLRSVLLEKANQAKTRRALKESLQLFLRDNLWRGPDASTTVLLYHKANPTRGRQDTILSLSVGCCLFETSEMLPNWSPTCIKYGLLFIIMLKWLHFVFQFHSFFFLFFFFLFLFFRKRLIRFWHYVFAVDLYLTLQFY